MNYQFQFIGILYSSQYRLKNEGDMYVPWKISAKILACIFHNIKRRQYHQRIRGS